LLGTAAYFWILNPVKVNGKQVEIMSMDKGIVKELEDFTKDNKDVLKEYKNKLPSNDYKDYKYVNITYDVSYQSVFEMKEFKAETYDFGLDDKRVFEVGKKDLVATKKGDEFKGRDAKAEYKGSTFIIYTKDMTDEEVKELATKITENINIKAEYKMDMVGDMKMDIKKGNVEFKDYTLTTAKDNKADDKKDNDKKDDKKDKKDKDKKDNKKDKKDKE